MYTLKLFGNKVSPACRHCAHGFPMPATNLVLCAKRGSVSPDFACRHYIYDPLMRIPKRPLQVEHYTEEEFQL